MYDADLSQHNKNKKNENTREESQMKKERESTRRIKETCAQSTGVMMMRVSFMRE